ncbi:MAG: fused MFS/spermidine synthase [Anaerolineales bacterium]|nr:fused MFS/spermidine synthase [Anaerolineales bacterium]
MLYFILCIFLSAFLLFQIQPMIAKYILPWFGGTPAVWSTVMLFFQVLLTGGYAYANWLTGRGRRREVVHLVLLGVALLAMFFLALVWKSPITPGQDWRPSSPDDPIWQIFKLLAVSVGLPYFLLSTNSPLMQAWFSRQRPGQSPYWLYALSNVGSLLALVSYPVLIEPALSLPWQGRLWSLGFVAFAGLAATGAIRTLRARVGQEREDGPQQEARDEGATPGGRDYGLWIALAATASVLLLAVTSRITQEVAVIPFLWVLPLTIYLLTFILAFAGERWYSRRFYLVLLFVATLLYGWSLVRSDTLFILSQIAINALVLFAACMVCHGELYRLRPHPDYLTGFYLMVSVGGAVGGLLITFVAPYVFQGYWEMPLGFLVCWLLFLGVTFVRREARRSRLDFVVGNVLMLCGLLIAGALAVQYILADFTDAPYSERNFYGVVRVREMGERGSSPDQLALIHGITIHGIQFQDPDRRALATMYFSETSGAGVVLRNVPRPEAGRRVGVLGLGIGTLATYGQPGDVYRFYEINPAVIRLAQGQGGYFTFLQESAAQVEVVAGDARLSLEAELASAGSQYYDILILDVFSSDSIPVHLLDAEAFALYLQHLKPDGLLLLHITNRHLDLVPVAWTLAGYYDLSFVLIDDPAEGVAISRSVWVLLARDPARLTVPAIQERAAPMDIYTTDLRLWTDDYSNLFQILK